MVAEAVVTSGVATRVLFKYLKIYHISKAMDVACKVKPLQVKNILEHKSFILGCVFLIYPELFFMCDRIFLMRLHWKYDRVVVVYGDCNMRRKNLIFHVKRHKVGVEIFPKQ